MSEVLDDDQPARSPEPSEPSDPPVDEVVAEEPVEVEAGAADEASPPPPPSPPTPPAPAPAATSDAEPSAGESGSTPDPEPAPEPAPAGFKGDPPPPPPVRSLRRTWPQRFVLGFTVIVALACVATAIALRYGYDTVNTINRVVLNRDPDIVAQQELSVDKEGNVIGGFNEAPPGELPARNFLLVGVDSRTCTPTNPQYAGAFGDGGGANTDTIMVLRTDPSRQQAAILSFPRDLWVQVPGGSSRQKINGFLTDPNNPQPLVDAIASNFNITIDHYIAVDFCGFRDLVNAVGPIRIPFEYPARDRNTGLNIPEPGCAAFDGDASLAYARSRHYQWQDEDGDWRDDDTSDYGRQARQQDFIRRVLRKTVDAGARDPGKLQQLVRIGLKYVTIDELLQPQDIYDLGRAFKDLDPNTVRSFTIVGNNAMRGDQFVISYNPDDPVNADIIRVFTGQALLSDTAPAEEAAAAPTGEAAAAPSPDTSAAAPVDEGIPQVTVDSTNERNADSIVPPDDPSCT